MKIHGLLALIGLVANSAYAVVPPSKVCLEDATLKNLVTTRLRKSCANVKMVELERLADQIYSNQSDSAGVCGRNSAIKAALMKNLGKTNCSEITPFDLLNVDEFYVEGNGKAPVTGLRHLTYNDLKGLKNATAVVFEYTYLETIEPGAFRDLKSVTNIEISHNRVSELDPELFCKEGFWGLPSIKTIDLDSNRPFKGATVPEKLVSCLTTLEGIDFDTDFITHLPRNLFVNNKALKDIDLKNNNISAKEVDYLQSLNNGSVKVEIGKDINDEMETWQIPDSI